MGTAIAGGVLIATPAADEDKDDTPAAAAPTEKEFVAVLRKRCLRCHRKNSASVEAAFKARWFVAGEPEKSRMVRTIGKHRKKGGTYHNLTDKEKQIIYDFIKHYEKPET